MDFISHGLWGGIAFGRASRRSFWTALLIGMAPDLLSFGLVFVGGVWAHGLDFFNGLGHPPDPARIPAYVYPLYDATHSLVVFAAVFGLVWLWRRKPLLELGAWGLHIAVDIFTHNEAFFPTPFLWPVAQVHVNGIPWGRPVIFIPNVLLLALLYGGYFLRRRQRPAPDTQP